MWRVRLALLALIEGPLVPSTGACFVTRICEGEGPTPDIDSIVADLGESVDALLPTFITRGPQP